MIWKLAPLVLSSVILAITIFLDYKTRVKRTRKLRNVLFLLVFALLVVSIVATCTDERAALCERQASQRQRKRLQSDLQGLRQQNASYDDRAEKRDKLHRAELGALRKTIADLNTTLAPFVALAEQRYPGVSQDTAMSRLVEDFRSLKARTAALERRTQPRSLSSSARVNALGVLRRVKDGRVSIYVPLGDQEALRFARQFKECLIEAGWRVDDIQNAIISPPVEGVRVVQREERTTPACDAVVHAVRLSGNTPQVLRDLRLPEGTVKLVIGTKEQ